MVIVEFKLFCNARVEYIEAAVTVVKYVEEMEALTLFRAETVAYVAVALVVLKHELKVNDTDATAEVNVVFTLLRWVVRVAISELI